MNKPTTDQVQQWAAEAGFPPHIRAAEAGRELDRIVAMAYAAGQAAERESAFTAGFICAGGDVSEAKSQAAQFVKCCVGQAEKEQP